MYGKCQVCGAVAPPEFFFAGEQYEQAMVVFKGLPQAVQEQVFFYLALFRPASGRSSSPKKALRLLKEISALVNMSHVQVQGRVARPCAPRIWAAAMEQMAERRHSLRLPMPNHNYLKQIAYDLADEEDRKYEAEVHRREQSGETPLARHVETGHALSLPLSQEEIDELPGFLKEAHLKRVNHAQKKQADTNQG